ncbi:MAG: hypothetical protein AAFY31_14150 [Pseudomonadota bacterium]
MSGECGAGVARYALLARFLHIAALVSIFWIGAPGHSHAATCKFDIHSTVGLPDTVVLRTLRCLVSELDRVKRENAKLKRRLQDIEGQVQAVPAPFSNIDGTVTEDPERAVGTATFIVSARSTGGASSLPIDQRALADLCGVKGGCSLSITFRQLSLFDETAKDTVLTGPCQFTYTPDDGAWSLGSTCGEAGPRNGIDGDRFATDDMAAETVILSSGEACLLSESAPSRSVGEGGAFQSDFSRGLFLVSMPARRSDGLRRFTCELVLK